MAKRKKSKLWRNIFIILGALLVLFIIFRIVFKKEQLTEVLTTEAKKVEIIEKVSASGKIQPEVEVKISPDVSGEIVELYVEEGDSVRAGQLLLKIRPDNFQDAVANASANVDAGRANYAQMQAVYLQRKSELARLAIEYKRNKELFNKKVISDVDFQSAKTNYEVAKQQVEVAKQNIEASKYNVRSSEANLNQNMDNLSRTEIYAPMSGIVSKLNIEKGEKVVGTAQMAGTEMLIIADLSNMEVQVDVNENDIIKVQKGQKVLVEVDAYLSQNRTFEGIVTEIANTANETATADAVTEFQVKIRILQSSYKDLIDKKAKRFPFRPGMTASVDVITEQKKGVLSVPISAVTTRSDKSETVEEDDEKKQEEDRKETVEEIVFVYNEKEGQVESREVRTGISDFENIEVLKGLKKGEEVVSGPFVVVSKQLEDKQKVEKKEAKEKK